MRDKNYINNYLKKKNKIKKFRTYILSSKYSDIILHSDYAC